MFDHGGHGTYVRQLLSIGRQLWTIFESTHKIDI